MTSIKLASKSGLQDRGTSVKDHPYNATALGVADETVAIQAVITAAIAAGKSKVVIPPGDYILNSGRLQVYSAARMTISGFGARLIQRDGCNARGFVVRGSTDIVVEGLTFKNEMSASASTDGLDIQNSSRVWVRNCQFIDHTFYGLAVTENTDSLTDATACDDIVITHNYFENIGQYGIEAFPKLTSRRQIIAFNTFKNCGLANTSGASIKCGSQTYGAICAHNTIYGGNIGIATGAHQTQLIEANTLVDCNQMGIAITPSDQVQEDPVTYPGRAFPLRQLLVVRGNQLSHSSGFTPTGTQPAIMVNGGTDLATTGLATGLGRILIEHNAIESWTGGGIHSRPTKSIPNIIVRSNKLRGNFGGVLIYTDNANGAYPDAMIVDDNDLENTDLSATTRNIILQSANGKVTNNRCRRLGSVAIQVFGDGMEVAHNRILEPNPAATANKAAIFVGDTTAQNYKIHHNYVDNGTLGNAASIIDASNGTPLITEYQNSSSTLLPVKRGTTALVGTPGSFYTMGGKRVFFGTAAPLSGGVYIPGDETLNVNPSATGGPVSWLCVAGGSPGTWRPTGVVSSNTSVGDADVTLTAGSSSPTQRYATLLTANRTVTLSTTDAWTGARFRVARTGLGAFTVDVGGLKTIPNSTAAFVDVEYDGAAWRLTGYGTL